MDYLSDYDYALPERLIAQTPLVDRDRSRLLWLRREGTIEHHDFRHIVDILKPGDLLVVNDTRVSAIRLEGKKGTGAKVEALLLHHIGDRRFMALVKPGRRLKAGSTVSFEQGLNAVVAEASPAGERILEFLPTDDFERKLANAGRVPLPPYIHEALLDRERYQTVYGSVAGSAAAPTAGLHFTEDLLCQLRERGVELANVTLDVGIDTFRPVQSENLDLHRMHGERCSVPIETAEKVAKAKGRIIAVGTTSVRTLESFAKGVRKVASGTKETKLFIRPGYRFRVIDGMFTNFHMPKTTMMMMISALAGISEVKRAYQEAVAENYRFLSFGDSMLIL